jgi:hypothetical protein
MHRHCERSEATCAKRSNVVLSPTNKLSIPYLDSLFPLFPAKKGEPTFALTDEQKKFNCHESKIILNHYTSHSHLPG